MSYTYEPIITNNDAERAVRRFIGRLTRVMDEEHDTMKGGWCAGHWPGVVIVPNCTTFKLGATPRREWGLFYLDSPHKKEDYMPRPEGQPSSIAKKVLLVLIVLIIIWLSLS
jgi:hypothetical protein